MSKISKQLLKSPAGFEDLTPAEAITQARVLDIIRANYERAGYAPLETPIVERSAILTAKAGDETQKQIYALRLLNPSPGTEGDAKDLALRYDHTVPLARFVAANAGRGIIQFPFRRYAIGPSFRGERATRDRYRQFIQADIDAIGDGELSYLHDAEMVSVVVGIFEELQVGDFTIRVNNRKVLWGFLKALGCDSETAVANALAIVDDLLKVGHDATVQALVGLGLASDKARELLQVLTTTASTDETLAMLGAKSFDDEYETGVNELKRVVEAIRHLGVAERRFCVDPSLARGLNYYTGTVYEGSLNTYPDLSIVGGGRFDNLAGSFTDQHLPGVGISIGVTRLVSRLIDLKLLSSRVSTVAPVLVTTALDLDEHYALYLRQASELRTAGIATEIYLEKKNLGKQMQFADRRGFTVVVITGTSEQAAGTVIVRNLRTGNQETVPQDQLVVAVQRALA